MIRAAAIVLAAGEGRRLGGVCKAALVLPDERTFVRSVLEAARAGGCVDAVVVAGPPHEAATRAAVAAVADATRLVVNPEPSRGMASSIALGLAALAPSVDVALVWPVDHPFVDAATVRALLAAADASSIVVPEHAGRGGHPTAFGRAWFAALAASVDRGGARQVIVDAGAAARRIPAGPSVARDVDVPTELPTR